MRTVLLLLTLISAAVACAAEPPADLPARVDAIVAPLVKHHVFSGAILAAKGDRILLNRAYGMASYEFGVANTPETRFAIASITKRFTGIIMSRLVEQGKVARADLLAKWVPDFPSADKITIEHLIFHRSGIRDPQKLRGRIRTSMTTAEVVEELKSEPLGSVPGETFSYTTANYAILAHVIERVTGQSWPEVIRRMIYEPAGMKDSGELVTAAVVPRLATGYMPNPFGDGVAVSGPEDPSWKAGGGSSYSTTLDLHRFHRALFGGKLTGAAKPEDLFRPSTLLGRRVLQSSGSFPGANAMALYFIDDEVSVVVLSNNYAGVTGSIAESVAALMFDQPQKWTTLEPLSNAPPADPRMAGRYTLGQYPFTLTVRNGRPLVTYNANRQSALLPLGGNRWLTPLDWGVFDLRIGPDGKIVDGTYTSAWGGEPMAIKPQ